MKTLLATTLLLLATLSASSASTSIFFGSLRQTGRAAFNSRAVVTVVIPASPRTSTIRLAWQLDGNDVIEIMKLSPTGRLRSRVFFAGQPVARSSGSWSLRRTTITTRATVTGQAGRYQSRGKFIFRRGQLRIVVRNALGTLRFSGAR